MSPAMTERRSRPLGRLAAVTLAVVGIIALPGFTVPPSPSPSEADPLRAAEYWLDDYGIRDAWKTSTGAGVKIAIIDTGIGKGPPEFSGVVGRSREFSGVHREFSEVPGRSREFTGSSREF